MNKKKSDRPQIQETAAFNICRNPNMPTDLTPRQNRVLLALLRATNWISREAIDRIAHASNGPEVIRQLRHRFGYGAIEMERINTIDRDGLPTQPGRYRLTPEGRAKLAEMGVM